MQQRSFGKFKIKLLRFVHQQFNGGEKVLAGGHCQRCPPILIFRIWIGSSGKQNLNGLRESLDQLFILISKTSSTTIGSGGVQRRLPQRIDGTHFGSTIDQRLNRIGVSQRSRDQDQCLVATAKPPAVNLDIRIGTSIDERLDLFWALSKNGQRTRCHFMLVFPINVVKL